MSNIPGSQKPFLQEKRFAISIVKCLMRRNYDRENISNMIKIKEIRPRAYHLIFDSEYDLTMTFVRPQEFYESPNPKFRGQVFTLEDYQDWYSVTYGKGVFTYTKDWSGFNMPSDVVQDFFAKFVKVLRSKEIALADALQRAGIDVLNPKTPPYYVMGTSRRASQATVDHEVRHGMFYLIPEYRHAIEEVVVRYRIQGLRSWLMRAGYARQVMIDEVQAYVLTG